MSKPRILLVGRHYIIEPLGIIYLISLAESLGWEARVHLVKDSDFSTLFEEIASFSPDLVGFSIWTGYHLKAFTACDQVRRLGLPVIIGGPHATYFTQECAQHADYVVKGEGFRTFRRILQKELEPGIHFDPVRVAEGFPIPHRETLYNTYPELGKSPIKSIMCSVGCPFTCSYCYAPVYNQMYGGFKLKVRPVDDIIREALAIKGKWPPSMIYFQDDIFGFDLNWLKEFVEKWQEKVAIPWHCQIRLELTRDVRRLALFSQGGCTGITLAIESGNDFLREFVLCRQMSEELICDGVQRIKDHGFTLRTEQILSVPFSDITTDLGTLKLNCLLAPQMAWTSILVPYGGTEMGTISSNFGLYGGNNDDIKETFFDRSVLHHPADGRETLDPIVRSMSSGKGDNPLLRMYAEKNGSDTAPVFLNTAPAKEPLCEISYLDETANEKYKNQTVMLQRLFNWLSRVPEGYRLGAEIVSVDGPDYTWGTIGALTTKHLERTVGASKTQAWLRTLACQMGLSSTEEMPEVLRQNPYYFVFFPDGPGLAKKVLEHGLSVNESNPVLFDMLGTVTRRHVFETSLYRISPAEESIAPAP